MKINRQNYVDEAEKAIKSMVRTDRNGNPNLSLTTSKIRNLLAMTAELKSDAQHSREIKLSADMQSRVQYLKMRIAYEAGRDRKIVQPFIERTNLYTYVSEIGQDRESLLLFCDYMEALTAYHRYYGGNEN